MFIPEKKECRNLVTLCYFMKVDELFVNINYSYSPCTDLSISAYPDISFPNVNLCIYVYVFIPEYVTTESYQVHRKISHRVYSYAILYDLPRNIECVELYMSRGLCDSKLEEAEYRIRADSSRGACHE